MAARSARPSVIRKAYEIYDVTYRVQGVPEAECFGSLMDCSSDLFTSSVKSDFDLHSNETASNCQVKCNFCQDFQPPRVKRVASRKHDAVINPICQCTALKSHASCLIIYSETWSCFVAYCVSPTQEQVSLRTASLLLRSNTTKIVLLYVRRHHSFWIYICGWFKVQS